MSDDGPPLVRPIPRRPFDVNFISPTPPSDTSTAPSPRPDLDPTARLLSPKPNGSSTSVAPTSDSGSISRTQSIMNLTSSTLFGIYSPSSSYSGRKSDRDASAIDFDTPWGTGAQTPVKRRTSIDESTFELMRRRSSFTNRRSSRQASQPQPSSATSAFFLVSRVALLFLLGMGYGALVTRVQHGEDLSGFKLGTAQQRFEWPSLAFWGVSGVVLGALLPWFDRVWADSFGAETGVEYNESDDEEVQSGTDWATAVRSIGAFVGIVFAIVRSFPFSYLEVHPKLTRSAETATLGVDATSVPDPRPCQPLPVVPHRPLETGLPALRRRRRHGLRDPSGRQPRHGTDAIGLPAAQLHLEPRGER